MKQGFSLVELSIVLVILGLLTGGILGGQSLMRAAELRTITQELSKYQIAINTFQDEYMGLPGDIANATAYWGAAHATPATCLTTTGSGSETCNGNKNSIIERAGNPDEYGEMFTFWQHLANAGLIEGQYNGIAGSGNDQHAIIGTNTPSGRLSNTGWSVRTFNNFPGDAFWFAGDYGHTFTIGTVWPNSFTWGKVLTPGEQWNIDKKIDDGKPGQGHIFAGHYATCTNAGAGNNTEADAIAADYALDVDDIECGIIFRQAF